MTAARFVAPTILSSTILSPAILSIALLLGGVPPAAAQEDHSGLTRARFVRNCLMCHSRAAPEGVAPEIVAGLHPEPGLRPADAMPTLTCWRRCDRCFAPDRSGDK